MLHRFQSQEKHENGERPLASLDIANARTMIPPAAGKQLRLTLIEDGEVHVFDSVTESDILEWKGTIDMVARKWGAVQKVKLEHEVAYLRKQLGMLWEMCENGQVPPKVQKRMADITIDMQVKDDLLADVIAVQEILSLENARANQHSGRGPVDLFPSEPDQEPGADDADRDEEPDQDQQGGDDYEEDDEEAGADVDIADPDRIASREYESVTSRDSTKESGRRDARNGEDDGPDDEASEEGGIEAQQPEGDSALSSADTTGEYTAKPADEESLSITAGSHHDSSTDLQQQPAQTVDTYRGNSISSTSSDHGESQQDPAQSEFQSDQEPVIDPASTVTTYIRPPSAVPETIDSIIASLVEMVGDQKPTDLELTDTANALESSPAHDEDLSLSPADDGQKSSLADTRVESSTEAGPEILDQEEVVPSSVAVDPSVERDLSQTDVLIPSSQPSVAAASASVETTEIQQLDKAHPSLGLDADASEPESVSRRPSSNTQPNLKPEQAGQTASVNIDHLSRSLSQSLDQSRTRSRSRSLSRSREASLTQLAASQTTGPLSRKPSSVRLTASTSVAPTAAEANRNGSDAAEEQPAIRPQVSEDPGLGSRDADAPQTHSGNISLFQVVVEVPTPLDVAPQLDDGRNGQDALVERTSTRSRKSQAAPGTQSSMGSISGLADHASVDMPANGARRSREPSARELLNTIDDAIADMFTALQGGTADATIPADHDPSSLLAQSQQQKEQQQKEQQSKDGLGLPELPAKAALPGGQAIQGTEKAVESQEEAGLVPVAPGARPSAVSRSLSNEDLANRRRGMILGTSAGTPDASEKADDDRQPQAQQQEPSLDSATPQPPVHHTQPAEVQGSSQLEAAQAQTRDAEAPSASQPQQQQQQQQPAPLLHKGSSTPILRPHPVPVLPSAAAPSGGPPKVIAIPGSIAKIAVPPALPNAPLPASQQQPTAPANTSRVSMNGTISIGAGILAGAPKGSQAPPTPAPVFKKISMAGMPPPPLSGSASGMAPALPAAPTLPAPTAGATTVPPAPVLKTVSMAAMGLPPPSSGSAAAAAPVRPATIAIPAAGLPLPSRPPGKAPSIAAIRLPPPE
ncbi:hypothetical protein BC831DRAFT_450376 [Entophlyctis helioformis]|nr:hypothetical protein BC831DRAFT_450376 [Entophlyctis helioformis]